MTHLLHGESFGLVPPWYADMAGAAKAGVSWPEFERWPLYRKNVVFAALTAEGQAHKIQAEKAKAATPQR